MQDYNAVTQRARAGGKRTHDHYNAESEHQRGEKRQSGGKRRNVVIDGSESTQTLRKRIRDTERLLRRPKLTADVKVNLERRLKTLHGQLEGRTQNRKEKRLADKYKMVKFVEEQKVVRKLNKVRRLLGIEASGQKVSKRAKTKKTDEPKLSKDERKKLAASLAELELDLKYIKHFPKDEKYIALFVDQKSDETAEAKLSCRTAARRAEIREQIRVAAEKGELDAPVTKKHKAEKSQKREKQASADGDDDFFAQNDDDSDA
ncbi:hypothetical protein THASP1DRAFT_28473 [Thamnocephalis sphaerospora]|uniref:rRNA-processing protein EFG1 n=1 Tax=Thamnocephalis sphaerospora TaxID=78915 RepID=A0A4P9XU53_9FUNG|nr:hypothetical protein THASP1DRAFT_28473 [Thamnocephalis sphaerospora]|eukprot:RKP09733.1 hypothetical protein THASP1DRAFT_28473 [Thamnocephalis sphaerospora]